MERMLELPEGLRPPFLTQRDPELVVREVVSFLRQYRPSEIRRKEGYGVSAIWDVDISLVLGFYVSKYGECNVYCYIPGRGEYPWEMVYAALERERFGREIDPEESFKEG